GGAERASYDLHVSLAALNAESTLVVGTKISTAPSIFQIPYTRLDALLWQLLHEILGLTEIILPTPLLGCLLWPFLRDADVVNVHNMHGRFWNLLTLLPLAMSHPMILTLHDEYLMTGDCCYAYDCERWKHSCGRCPQARLEMQARYAIGGM